jgi:serine/threonine protein kinase/Tfp pilus assembly protein PilF
MNEEAIFLEALENATPEDRAAFLDRACADDAELRRAVELLLKAHEQAGDFLQKKATISSTIGQAVSECPGTAIDSYKLLEQIGEGAFGVVFMAEQQHPLRRKVALKVLKPGMDTRQVLARFEAERQALALMDHPHIACVFDGGETDAGRPYFVMELVKGIPITDYCDQGQLPTHDRLKLFISLCQAVQHAHQKGIIHRDLKPSNVLVTLHDGVPVVKVIDFGIAKTTGQQLTDKTLFTNFAQLVGTPLYMSPEQAALSGLDVDTRSDIYSLGVLLYELLTGTTPFDKDRFKTADYDEIRRIIREEDPPKPSTRLSTLAQSAGTVSTPGSGDSKRLSKLVRGELDWIVMKCLEKDRNRRYETANGLVMDIERYLHDEPVLACPPSPGYRFRKFARRHRRALMTATLLAVMLLAIVSAVAGSLGWVARDKAARLAVSEGKAKVALDEATELERQKKWPEALEAVKRADGFAAMGAGENLRERVWEVRKDVKMVLRLEEIWLPRPAHGIEGSYDNKWADSSYAEAFRKYGIDVDALETSEAAERIKARAIRLELAVALDVWADRRQRVGGAGDESWKRLLQVARTADPDPWRVQMRNAALRTDREGLKRLAASAIAGELPVQTVSLLSQWLPVDFMLPILRHAQREHPDNFHLNFQLAWYLATFPTQVHRPYGVEAIRFYTAALAVRPRNAPTAFFLGENLRGLGRFDEAIAMYEKAMVLDPKFPRAFISLVIVLQEQGKFAEASATLRKVITLTLEDSEELNILAWFLAAHPDPRLRNPVRAVELANKAVQLAPGLGEVWNTLGVARYRAGDWKGAIAALQQSMALRNGGDSFDWFFLAMAQWQQNEQGEARDWYHRAVRWMETYNPENTELRRFRAEAAELMGPRPEADPLKASREQHSKP